MEDTTGPPQKKKAKETDYLADFLQDVREDEKFSEQLVKLRSGAPAARKQAMRSLTDSTHCVPIIEAALPMLREPNIDVTEKSRLVKLLYRILQKQPSLGMASPIAPLADPLLNEAKRLLENRDKNKNNQNIRPTETEEGVLLLSSLVRVIGMKSFLTTIRPSFDSFDDNTRRSNAIAITVAARTFGIPLTLPLIKALVNHEQYNVKQLGLAIVQHLPKQLGKSLLPFLKDLVSYCIEALKEPHLSGLANSALTNLADAVSPLGIDAFDSAMDALWAGARRRRGKPKLAFLRTLAALTPLTNANVASELASPVLEMTIRIIEPGAASGAASGTTSGTLAEMTAEISAESPAGSAMINTKYDLDEKRSALGVARRCIHSVNTAEVKEFLRILFSHYWIPEAASDRRTASLAVWTAVELPISRSDLIFQLVVSNVLVSDSLQLQTMGLELLARLDVASLVLDQRTEDRLMDGLLVSLPDSFLSEDNQDADNDGIVNLDRELSNDHDGGNGNNNNNNNNPVTSSASAPPIPVSVRAIRNVFESLPQDRVTVYSQTWISILLERDSNPSPAIRESSLRILAAITQFFPKHGLLIVLRRLYEELGEEYPEVLSEVINSLHSVIDVLGSSIEDLNPSASQILPRLTPILRNRNEKVQESCIKLIRTISELAGDTISAREWMQVCFELLELQKSQRQKVRFEATAAFASISTIIGPADVVSTLLNHLKSPDRQFRVTTAAAIASVAVETGPFTVLPILINEYSLGDITMQHGVLKTLDFIFQFLDSGKGLPYIDSLVTLLDDALVDTNQVHRQTAASIIHHMALGSIGHGKEETFIHFLNELMPSIFETSPHVINRVLEAIESIRTVIGTPAFTNYMWAGLYHPARKVRNVYWTVWNTMYQKDADTLVPTYPIEIPDPLGSGEDIRDIFI